MGRINEESGGEKLTNNVKTSFYNIILKKVRSGLYQIEYHHKTLEYLLKHLGETLQLLEWNPHGNSEFHG